jgi:hypothetical protein
MQIRIVIRGQNGQIVNYDHTFLRVDLTKLSTGHLGNFWGIKEQFLNMLRFVLVAPY